MAKGDRYRCDECGLIVLVEDPCNCTSCNLICCDVPMKKVTKKATPTKAKK